MSHIYKKWTVVSSIEFVVDQFYVYHVNGTKSWFDDILLKL